MRCCQGAFAVDAKMCVMLSLVLRDTKNSTTQHNTTQHNTAQHSNAQHGIIKTYQLLHESQDRKWHPGAADLQLPFQALWLKPWPPQMMGQPPIAMGPQ